MARRNFSTFVTEKLGQLFWQQRLVTVAKKLPRVVRLITQAEAAARINLNSF